MPQLTNLAFFRARAGASDALGETLSALVTPTRAELACINYDLHRAVEDPLVWFVYENWRSAEGLDAHMRSPHLKAFLAVAPDLLDGDIDLRQFAMVSSPA